MESARRLIREFINTYLINSQILQKTKRIFIKILQWHNLHEYDRNKLILIEFNTL